MNCNIDLRYVVPAVISIFFVVLPSENNLPIPHNNLGIIPSLGDPIFVMVSLVLAVVIFVFLFTSFNLPLTVKPIYLRTRHFSLSWTLSLLASLIFPPSHFWLFFPILVIMSPWDTMLLDRVISLPARIIFCVPQRQREESEPQPPPPQVAIQVIENEGIATRM
ncbi:hypothetical protein FH972_027036 [Carpinus fangiana]|uniref:Uncharacterized protein n=1 Tax=Carpinus fangiana TaxID=176857 RepID=A0A5N6L653_9ROSI|nr:hypothetical protein FH972_027036 [Carpinus fangiana]